MSSDSTTPMDVQKTGKGSRPRARFNIDKWLMPTLLLLVLASLVGWVLLHLLVPAPPVETAQPVGTPQPAATAQAVETPPPPKAGAKWTGPYQQPPLQWLDWLLISLCGVLLYLLASAAYYRVRGNTRFSDFAWWYVATIVKGPIVAFIILLFLTQVSVDITGLSIDLTKPDTATVLLVVAFILGFYSRVAREQLNQIVKALFPKAYGIAEEQFNIVPGKANVQFGQTAQFGTSKAVEVIWLTSTGKIDDKGLFTAPSATEAHAGDAIRITAVPKDPNVPTASALATLVAFSIVGKDKLLYGAEETYQTSPAPEEGVTWSVTPKLRGAAITDKGIYKAPPAPESAVKEKVAITATCKTNPLNLATLEVELQAWP